MRLTQASRARLEAGHAQVPRTARELPSSPARPLDVGTRTFLEPQFGHDFSRLQLHTPAITISPSHGELERNADAMARAVLAGAARVPPSVATGSSGPLLQRAGFGEVRAAEGLHEEQTREEATRGGNEEPLAKARRILTERDKTSAMRAAPGTAEPARVTPGIRGAHFVLHDTAALVGSTRIAEHQARGRRSSGEGAGAWVPQSGAATVSHDPFFGPRRPAATQFERGQDIMAKAQRETEYRNVWKATDSTQREAALDAVLRQQGSPADEATKERAAAIAQLNAASGEVRSAAAWASEDICGMVADRGAAAVAASAGASPKLDAACGRLAPLFAARRSRIESSVNVEIVQERGSDCRTTGSLVAIPAYTASQYDNVKQLYFRAALEARFFPEITTHFLIDRGTGDHCDPRCFDLTRLYREIAAALGHRAGSTYGVAPSYGTSSADNVWWNDTVCGGAHP